MDTLIFDGREINITGMIPDGIIGVFSAKEPVETIEELNQRHRVEIHPDDNAIILVRKPR